MSSSARAQGPPAATGAFAAVAAEAPVGPVAAGRWDGIGRVSWDEHPGGEAEERQARVAQKAATPEPDLRELLVV